jgi:hypothetical protein
MAGGLPIIMMINPPMWSKHLAKAKDLYITLASDKTHFNALNSFQAVPASYLSSSPEPDQPIDG